MSVEVCRGFVPQPCFSYTNCTLSGFIHNWTEYCCQPESVRSTRTPMLSVIGFVGITGIVCNMVTIFSFLYLYFFHQRIKTKFGQDFKSITDDPVFFLILNLSVCDLLYCVVGLPSYWDMYYYGYYPYSESMCKYTVFIRDSLGNHRICIRCQ